MSIEQYFEQEYNFLQLAGKEFAEKHKTLGGRLRLSERERKDPFVERLFEGFAFLAGRIHERLDDDFPEFTHSLMDLVYPQFLRPFPSCAILEAKGRTGVVTRPVIVPKGSEVRTRSGKVRVRYKVSPFGETGGRLIEKEEPADFVFRTTQQLVVRPMNIREVRLQSEHRGTSSLLLHVQIDRNVPFEALDLKQLRLYLHGSPNVVHALRLFLSRFVEHIAVRPAGKEEADFSTLRCAVGIPGLDDRLTQVEPDLSLLPYPRQVLPGYQLLQEYFAFPEKFSFVDIEGLHEFPAPKGTEEFAVKIAFDRRLPYDVAVTNDTLKLHCTPMINLFDRSTEPVPVTARQPEYYIVPDLDRRRSTEIYSVRTVTGISENKKDRFRYLPVTSQEMLDPHETGGGFTKFFSIMRKPLRGDMAETYIRLIDASDATGIQSRQTLSIEATLSNGFLPAQYIEQGMINEPSGFPPGIEARNLTVPTDMLECPSPGKHLWMLVSHLSAGFSTLADAENLKGLLMLYNWHPAERNANRKRIEAIQKVHPPELKNVFRDRGVMNAVDVAMEILPREFEHGEGDITLFGTVLHAFLSQYVSINTALSMTLHESETEKKHEWEPAYGMISPL